MPRLRRVVEREMKFCFPRNRTTDDQCTKRPTRRQSQRPGLSRRVRPLYSGLAHILPTHASRQSQSRLISDVGQKNAMLSHFIRFAILVVAVGSAGAAPIANSAITVAGDEYVQVLESDDFAGVPKWKFGDGEPPISAGRAITLATAACAKQFGGKVRAELWMVALQKVFGIDCIYYEVVFLEQLTKEEIQRRERPIATMKVSGGTVTTAEVPRANIRYFILLDGRVIGPKKKG
jgi:hypothetical protein